MRTQLGHRALWLLATVAFAPSALRAQAPADSAALARLAAAVVAAQMPEHRSDSVVLVLPRTRWDSAVVHELRSMRHWPVPTDTVQALHIGQTTLWFKGDRAIVTVTASRCQLEIRSRLNWWRDSREYEFRRVGLPGEARWEAVVGPRTTTSEDGHCTRSVRPGS